MLALAAKYARTHRDALTRGEALRFLGDHVAELPNVSLLRRGAAYALAASRAAPAEFYGGDGAPQISKGRGRPSASRGPCEDSATAGTCYGAKQTSGPRPTRAGASLQWLASCDTASVGDDRGRYPLDSLLKLWACLPEAVAREATKNAIDDCHAAVRKPTSNAMTSRARSQWPSFGDKGDAAADVGALESAWPRPRRWPTKSVRRTRRRARTESAWTTSRSTGARRASAAALRGRARGTPATRLRDINIQRTPRSIAGRRTAPPKKIEGLRARPPGIGREGARALHARAKEPERRPTLISTR